MNIAARVQAMADAAEIWITEEVWRYPGVQTLLAHLPDQAGTAEFQGVGRPMPVMRIGGAGQAGSQQGADNELRSQQ